MENLHISDAPPPQQQQQQGQASQGHGRDQSQGQAVLGGAAAPPQSTQLPPQMFTTAAQLLDLTDKKLMVALRDGRKLIGVLRSWDQFANLVLQNTVERIFAHPPTPPAEETNNGNGSGQIQQRGLYADVNRGVFLVRGENVLLLGEIDLDKDDDSPPGYDAADPEVVHKLAEERKEKDKAKDKSRLKKLAGIGFEGENMGEVLF